MTAPYGIPSVQVDGMDVLAVREATEEAIRRARNGDGPSLIEAMTYRYGGQYEGDTQTYKPPKEVEWWREQDPLPKVRATLEEQVDAATLDAVERNVVEEVAAAFAAAEAAPWPDISQVTADVYTTSNP